MTTKQVEDLIARKKSDGIRYHYTHVCRLLHKWIQTEGTKTGTCKHSIKRREGAF